jgi:hypothetical protein
MMRQDINARRERRVSNCLSNVQGRATDSKISIEELYIGFSAKKFQKFP